MLETGRKECPIGTLVSSKQSAVSSEEQQRLYASGSLFPRTLETDDVEHEKKRILEVLNNKFLPYWSASPLASLREALVKNNGVYRIGFRVSVPSLQRGMSEGQGDLVSEKSEQNPQLHTDTV